MNRIPVTGLLMALFLAAPGALCGDDAVPLDLGSAAGEEATKAQGGSGETTDEEDGGAGEPQPFDGGRIEGTLLPASRVKQVRLVERSSKLSRIASYDRETGRFIADELPSGVWAVEIDTTWGLVQGVDMRFRPGELERAAKPRDADPPKPPPLDDEDRAEITRHITGPERFMTARPLMFAGDGRQATVLVNLLRDRAFHQRKGDEVIWRLETWYYEDKWGHWDRLGGTVIFRDRLSGAVFRKRTRQFEPSLGGLEITPRTTAPLVVGYTVAEFPDPSRGLVAEGQRTAPARAPGDAGSPARPKAEPATPADVPKSLDEQP